MLLWVSLRSYLIGNRPEEVTKGNTRKPLMPEQKYAAVATLMALVAAATFQPVLAAPPPPDSMAKSTTPKGVVTGAPVRK